MKPSTARITSVNGKEMDIDISHPEVSLRAELEQVRASHKRQCDLNDKAWEKVREVEKELAEAKEVLQYYADSSLGSGAWSFRKKFLFDLIDESDLEYVGEPRGDKKQRYVLGGKRARAFLGRAK